MGDEGEVIYVSRCFLIQIFMGDSLDFLGWIYDLEFVLCNYIDYFGY